MISFGPKMKRGPNYSRDTPEGIFAHTSLLSVVIPTALSWIDRVHARIKRENCVYPMFISSLSGIYFVFIEFKNKHARA